MNGSQINLNYRVSASFGPNQLDALLRLAHDSMGFDEDTRYDLTIQKNDGERIMAEIAVPELEGNIHSGVWGAIHQIIISSQWIKGMNLKLTLVRRQDYHTLSLKGELETAEARAVFAKKIEGHLAGVRVSDSGAGSTDQERERLFGSMLMTETILRATRQSFLAGQFDASLAAASSLLQDRLGKLLGITVKKPGDIAHLLAQEPPRLLFPDLSGSRLQLELAGLGSLCAGALTLTQPVVAGGESAPEDPARVLRCLVLFGMLLERLEVATPNPAAGRVVSRPSAAKKKTPAKGQPGRARAVRAKKPGKTGISRKKTAVKSRRNNPKVKIKGK